MATENPRVWFKSISLENVRSFGTKQTINFTDKDGKAARWNVILGDNGTGKTTVLKGISILSGKASDRDIIPMLRHNSSEPSMGGIVKKGEEEVNLVSNIRLQAHRHMGPFVLSSGLSYNIQKLGEDFLIFAYGASRRVGSVSDRAEQISTVANLFDETAQLASAESWLLEAELNYLKNISNNYELVKSSLMKLFLSEVKEIKSRSYYGSTPVFFETNYGEVMMSELSLGYKTLIAWIIDFAKGLFSYYPTSENPLAEPAVCLVDEIDLHLHPKFQRTIIQFLTETFPNTQFIVTAHSPLIVLAAEERPLDANIILLKREDDHTVVVNDPVDVGKWSVDQILNSDLFGYVPPVSEPLTELRVERDALLAKPKLAKKEQVRLAELDEKIGFIPFGNNQDEIKAETIIQQLANELRSKQEVQ
ncbi:AAA family ATPase [Spirosoma pulveris]